MADWTQFDGRSSDEPMNCDLCEAMLLDAVDGTLSAEEQADFERHVAGCVACARDLAEARRGAAWMEMLKEQKPEPSAALLSRILAETTGRQAQSAAVATMPVRAELVEHAAPAPHLAPASMPGKLLAFRRKLAAAFSFDASESHFQPRLAMTAAMAFFSIALTMNIGGIRLTDLRPSALQRTLADLSASASRSIQNMRVVYQVESQINDLRDDRSGPLGEVTGQSGATTQQPPAASPAAPQPDSKGKGANSDSAVPQGTSQLEFPAFSPSPSSQKSSKDTTDRAREPRSGQSAAGFDETRMQEGA